MKVYKVTIDGIEYNVQLKPETAEEIGAVLVGSNKAAAASAVNKAEKPAVGAKEERPRRKPGPKPKQKAGE